MEQTRRLTAIIEREDDGFVALCPEVDVASEGSTIEKARDDLVEALTLFFEVADDSEISRRMHREVFVTQVEVPVGKLRVLSVPVPLHNPVRHGTLLSIIRQSGLAKALFEAGE
jgi:predicted RNase H-like HicB family nuclease